jgi:hypothetical protein
MSLDIPIFKLIRARIKALGNDLEFPPEVRDQTKPLLSDAVHKIKSATALYDRVSEIHADNEDKRLPSPGGQQ